MSTDASTGHGPVPRTFHHMGRRPTSTPSFGERRPVTGSIVTICLLVLLGVAVGAALGGALAMVVQGVLDVLTPWMKP
jgi:hypothetical protein